MVERTNPNEAMYRINYETFRFPEGLAIPEADFKPVELDVDAEHLTGFIISEDQGKAPDFAFIHGARMGSKQRVLSFAEPMIEAGTSILAFDHSGHGDSTGDEHASSLAKRENEAAAMIEKFASKGPLAVCGSSMGSYTAIKMLERFEDIQSLILFCPGIYDRDAVNLTFDHTFTEAIRRPESWKNTDAGEILEKFTGNLLVLIGSEDMVIPAGVIDLIDQHSNQTARKEIITIPNCPHKIQDWLPDHPDKALEVARKVAEYSKL